MSALEIELARAAQERTAGMAARADRPRQRRNADEPGAAARASAQIRGLQLREAADGSSVEFVGEATVYERGYEMYDFFGPYTEIVTAGAGTDSLARANLDVPLVLQHQDLRRIARTTNGSLLLEETEDALQVRAPQLDLTDPDVAYIVPKLRSQLVDEMSFKFRITSGHWSPDYTEYRIDAYDIHRGDVAIVGYGANPATTAAVRAQRTDDCPRCLELAAAAAATKTPRALIAEDDTRPRVLH